MVVDDLENFRLLQAVHRLGALVVVHQDDPFAVEVQQVPAADHTAVFAVFVQNGEIPVAHAGHDLAGILNGGVDAELHQVVGAHEVAHRGRRGHQPPRRVGVVGGGQHRTALLLGAGHDGAGHRRTAADHNGRRAAVDGAHLGLVPVGNQHQVAGLHQLLHDLGAGADADMPLGDAGVGVAHDELRLQRLQQVVVAGVGRRQHAGVKQIHVGVGNVLDGDKALQLVLPIGDAQRVDFHVAHHVPGRAHAQLGVDARLVADVDILDLGAHVGAEPRRLHAEMLEHKLGLPVHMPGPASLILACQAAAVFQPGVGQRRTDGVGIGVLVADDVDMAHIFS